MRKEKKLEDDFFLKKGSHNLHKSVRKLEGKSKQNLMTAKNQKKHRSTETGKV